MKVAVTGIRCLIPNKTDYDSVWDLVYAKYGSVENAILSLTYEAIECGQVPQEHTVESFSATINQFEKVWQSPALVAERMERRTPGWKRSLEAQRLADTLAAVIAEKQSTEVWH